MNSSHLSRRDSLRAILGLGGLPLLTTLAPTAQAEEKAKKRIGFVDRHLDNYHANVFLRILRGDLAKRGFEVTGCTAIEKESGKAWATKNKVAWYDDVDALDPHVDFYFVLAPSNPELHLDLAKAVLPKKKATYIDKTFAPDLETAKMIFAIADEHGTPLQTTSALRYTDALQYAGKTGKDRVLHMVSWGPGGNFDEYAIHPLEHVVSTMGHEVLRVMRRGKGQHSQLLLDFSDGRTAVVNVYIKTRTAYSATVTTAGETKYLAADISKIFVRNCAAVLDLFESGKPNVDRRETLAIMKILDFVKRPEALKGFVSLSTGPKAVR